MCLESTVVDRNFSFISLLENFIRGFARMSSKVIIVMGISKKRCLCQLVPFCIPAKKDIEIAN